MRDLTPDKRQVISTKNIIDILRTDTHQDRTKDVLKPCAQITTLCDGSNQLQYIVQRLEKCKAQLKRDNVKLYFIVLLQFENALRISEVLSISPVDIDNFGNVLIKSGKGSKHKIIPTGEARQFLLECKRLSIFPFIEYNRFFIYRLYKKYNIELLLNNRSKSSVTHSARHIAAIAGRKAKFEESVISSHLSHKSLKSTNHYGK